MVGTATNILICLLYTLKSEQTMLPYSINAPLPEIFFSHVFSVFSHVTHNHFNSEQVTEWLGFNGIIKKYGAHCHNNFYSNVEFNNKNLQHRKVIKQKFECVENYDTDYVCCALHRGWKCMHLAPNSNEHLNSIKLLQSNIQYLGGTKSNVNRGVININTV